MTNQCQGLSHFDPEAFVIDWSCLKGGELFLLASGLFGKGSLLFLLVGAADLRLLLRGLLLCRLRRFVTHNIAFVLR
jgi:hypothetical protein